MKLSNLYKRTEKFFIYIVLICIIVTFFLDNFIPAWIEIIMVVIVAIIELSIIIKEIIRTKK